MINYLFSGKGGIIEKESETNSDVLCLDQEMIIKLAMLGIEVILN